MRFGILGYRHVHIEMFIQEMLQLGHTFIGICEKNHQFAGPLAAKYGVTLIEDEEVFFDLEPDIIGTSEVNNKKIDIIEKCDKRCIHVMVDKPAVTNIKDYEKLSKIVDKDKIKVGMMLTERFNPPIFSAWKLIKNGEIGELISLTFMKPHRLREGSREPWHFSKTENGGIIIDLLIHDFDLIRWFTDSEILDSYGYIRNAGHSRYPDFFDSTNIIMKTQNGVVASLEADWRLPDKYWTWGDGRINCVGTCGRIEVKTVGDLAVKKEPYATLITNDGEYRILDNEPVPTSLTQDFLERIAGKKEVIITSTDILKALHAALVVDERVINIK